jgi:hypothetical protein
MLGSPALEASKTWRRGAGGMVAQAGALTAARAPWIELAAACGPLRRRSARAARRPQVQAAGGSAGFHGRALRPRRLTPGRRSVRFRRS